MGETQVQVRTYINKVGDREADRQIEQIVREGWKISCVTPNGTITITTFCK
ncbi:hypothetical protein [Treponema sp.]|uniref:hypothetical protein n=1 Tax=Treponema sp. TaxID=166 RepID=UPI00298DC415|nr:hypothetical protein [Treponema sp.]MCR5613096.1 hypothetical protein [Treponema sp.]